jgi:hypothetical protein
MALIRGNLDIADAVLATIIARLNDFRSLQPHRTFVCFSVSFVHTFIFLHSHSLFVFSLNSQPLLGFIHVALSVTAGGYHALTTESLQDIRWSMQGYRKKMVREISTEARMLNMLQRLLKFSSMFIVFE